MPWNADHTIWTTATGRQLTQAQVDAGEGRGASGNPFAVEGGDKQLAGDIGGDFNWLGTSLGFIPKQIDPSAPGASLDTGNADIERNRLTALRDQLQQQAATGNGSWQKTLQTGTDSANAAAQSLGQTPGQGYASSLHNIGNAQAGNTQRAVGQGNILRAQSQQAGQQGLSDLLNGTGAQDINQADASSKTAQGVRDMQGELNSQANKNLVDTVGKIGQAAAMASDGGKVAGSPKVSGDSPKNDTVPTWLSPGEGVVPISHMDSPEHAKQFIDALFASKSRPQIGVQHFDGGGHVGDGVSGDPQVKSGLTNTGSVGQDFGSEGEAPSVKNGGLLNTAPFEQNRAASNANSQIMEQQALGQGPSVAPQRMQNAQDQSLLAAMQAQASGRAVPGIVQAGSGALQGAAGSGAEAMAGEQQHAQQSFVHEALQRRQQELAMAQAQQQAAFHNTQINAGMSLASQAALRNALGGAGQAAAAYSSATPSGSGGVSNTPSFDQGFGSGGDSGGSSASDWENPYGSSSSSAADLHDRNDLWTGGEVESPNDAWANKMSEASASATKENADFKAKKQRGEDAVSAEKSYQSAPNDAWAAKMKSATNSANAENYDFAQKREQSAMEAKKAKALVNALRASR